MIIIGIDPGSRNTGYGVIHWQNNQSHYIDSGHIALSNHPTNERLQKIYHGIRDIVSLHQPHEAAIEQIFMHENPSSALKLGQARGAAIVALGLQVAEYSARQVKQSVVGYGAADKTQVQHMVRRLLNLPNNLQADEADALAVALCHAHARFCTLQLGNLKRTKTKTSRSSWRQYRP